MSVGTLTDTVDSAREAAASVAWRQWAALGAMASDAERARSMVDPEALLLISLSLREHERRLWDVLRSWIPIGVRLLSVQRTKNLVPAYPEQTREALSEFATLARKEGKDARWKALSAGAPASSRASREKRWQVSLDALEDAGLALRLRRGLGISLRADVLTFLLGNQGRGISVRGIADALGYTNVATRRAADDLAGARFIRADTNERPATYSADPKAWSRVLSLLGGSPPAWHHWCKIFALIATLDEWEKRSRDKSMTPYAIQSLGTELLENHRGAFADTGIEPSVLHVGAMMAKTGPFEASIAQLSSWMVHNV